MPRESQGHLVLAQSWRAAHDAQRGIIENNSVLKCEVPSVRCNFNQEDRFVSVVARLLCLRLSVMGGVSDGGRGGGWGWAGWVRLCKANLDVRASTLSPSSGLLCALAYC